MNIDTFTFDDFVFAMGWNADQFSEDGRCELLDEIWCAVLSAIVSNELPTNKEAKDYKERDEIYGLTITLPKRMKSMKIVKTTVKRMKMKMKRKRTKIKQENNHNRTRNKTT